MKKIIKKVFSELFTTPTASQIVSKSNNDLNKTWWHLHCTHLSK